jgi:hypothetical protein
MVKAREAKKRNDSPAPKTMHLDPLKIELDPDNPRLTPDEQGRGPDELLRIMIERFKIEELAESIVAAGYLPFDPLVGWEHDGVVTILEGNRRIAAIKLLLNPELAPEGAREKWRRLSASLPATHRKRMSPVSLTVYADRTAFDVTAYIGFRHVTGVLKWPALEKASFIAKLVESYNWTFEQIAERLGSYPKPVERHYVAHQIVRQASKEGIDGAENMQRTFGVLLRALQAAGVPEFLGVVYPGDPTKSREPVPASHIQNLRDFVEWTFGTKDKERILPDSRRLTDWGKILQSPAAISYMRRAPRPDFDRAWLKSGGQAESLADSLFTAADRLEESVPLVSENKDDQEVQDAVRQCVRFLVQILAHFDEICTEYGIKLTDVRPAKH